MRCARGSVTDFVRQSYPDRVPDPRRGERSVKPHHCVVHLGCTLVSADESLIWNRIYIVRFYNMRSMYHASRWAEVSSHSTHPSIPTYLCQQEAQKKETAIFWNVWVLLALPRIWLTWSVLAFIVTIMISCTPYACFGITERSGAKRASCETGGRDG